MTLEYIMNVVADKTNFSINEIKGKSRKSELALSRHCFCYFAYQYPFSLKTIGRFINRDHTTVMHSIEKINDLLIVYSEVKLLISSIKRSINYYSIEEDTSKLLNIPII